MRRAWLLILAASGCGRDAGVTLGDAEVISTVTGVGAAPMIALSPSGARTVAWISAPGAGSDGRMYTSTDGAPPSELRDPLGGIEPHGEAPPKLSYGPDGTLYALYAVGRVEAGRRFPFTTLRLATSRDGGRSWSAPASVGGDSVMRSRNFHALHVAASGSIYVAWLESRDASGSATYLTRSDDQGTTWSPAVRVAADASCPCCRVAMATSPGGRVYLAWRTVLPGNVRDIVVAASDDRGLTWSRQTRVHADDWVFEGCPHAGPSILAAGDSTLHVAWWTGAPGTSGVFYARSSDGGGSFGPRVPLGAAAFTMPAHVQLARHDAGVLVAAWDDGRDSLPRVMLRLSRDDGVTFGASVLAGAPGAASTFPVVALHGDSLAVAWSQRTAASHAHAGHAAPDMRDPDAVMPLPSVGEQQILVRRGRVR